MNTNQTKRTPVKRLIVLLVGSVMTASLVIGIFAASLTARSAAGDPHEYAGQSTLLAQGDPHEYARQSVSLVEYAYPSNGGTGLLDSPGVCNFYNCGIGWM